MNSQRHSRGATRKPVTARGSTQSIGSLAKATGVGIDAIRFYERIGLLPAPRRSASGYRQYAGGDQKRLQFIRRAQDLGFSLDEIASLLKLSQPGGSVAKAKALAAAKLQLVEGKLAELQRLQQALHTLVHQCPGSGDSADCPILSALSGGPTAERGNHG